MRLIKTLLTLCFVLNCCIVQGQEEFPFVAEVVRENVNVRSGQGIGFDKVFQLATGDRVVVVDKNFSWYKVKLPLGSSSYMSAKYVRMLGQNIGEVTGGRVNVRAGPGTKYSALGQLKIGNKVRTVEVKDGWARIEPAEGIYGWIQADFLKYVSNNIPPPVVVEGPVRNIYKLRRMEQEKESLAEASQQPIPIRSTVQETVQPRPDASGSVVITGTLQVVDKELTALGIHHKVIVDNRDVYYLQGPRSIIERFVNNKVKVEGTIKINSAKKYEHPVIRLKKITFVL